MGELRIVARAPVYRETDGQVVSTIWSGTQCWAPKRPSRFAVFDEHGDQGHVIRCGLCGGCNELDRLRLARRLREHYREYPGELYIVLITAALKEHGAIARTMHRLRGWSLEPATYRAAPDQLAFIAREDPRKFPRPRFRRRSDYTMRVIRVRGRRRTRAWRALTRGMHTMRVQWGEQVKRWYHRGLPPRAREYRWAVSTRAGLSSAFGAQKSARAHRLGLSILPPLDFSYPKLTSRRKGSFAASEQASAMLRTIVKVLSGKFGEPFAPNPARSAAPILSASRILSKAKEAGYGSSVHPQTGEKPVHSVDSRRDRGPPAPATQSSGAFDEWAARMIELARKRDAKDPPK